MGNFRKLLCSALVAGVALGAASDVLASGIDFDIDFRFNDRDRRANGDGQDSSRGARFGNGHRNRGPRFSVESKFIGKTMFPGERLLLGRELGLPNHRGKKIEEVQLEIEGMRRGGQMTLEINGQRVSRIQDFQGGRVGDQVITFPLARPFVIGENVRSIQVVINGTAYVREALVVLKEAGRGGAGRVIDQRVFASFRGPQVQKLIQILNAGPRRERMNVGRIVLQVRSNVRFGQLSLCESSFNRRPRGPGPGNCVDTGAFQGFGVQRISLNARGMDLNDIELMGRGDFTITHVTVHPAR